MSDQEVLSDKKPSSGDNSAHRPYISMDDSITTDCDPDHKSYIRHFESSESARKALPKEYNKKGIRTLAELSSTLSASSSLSGSTQHPNDHDDDDDDEDNDNHSDMNGSDVMSNHSMPISNVHGNTSAHSSRPRSLVNPSGSTFMDIDSDNNTSTSNVNTPLGNANPNKHKNALRFKHYHKPKVTESPRLVYLCQKYINERNVEGLALIARRRGLPPKLRQYAWPLLLASHTYVLNPSVVAEYPTQPLPTEQIPIKRIQKEIARYQKKQASSNPNKSRATTANNGTTASTVNDTTTSHLLHKPTISTTSTSSTPPLAPADAAKTTPDQWETITAASLEAQKQNAIEEAIKLFLAKWGAEIPYENAMVWLAFALAEWVDPVCRLDDKYATSKQTTGGTNTTESQASSPDMGPVDGANNSHFFPQSKGTSPIHSGVATPTLESGGFSLRSLSFQLPYVFSEVFEHLMLVCFHSPQSALNGPRGPCDSPLSDRISFFLSIIRRLLPDLAKHFDEEDAIVGGDEWLLWWIKWMGAKVWDKRDRARIWDMYFGWRPTPATPGFDLQEVMAAKIQEKVAHAAAKGDEITGSLEEFPSTSPAASLNSNESSSNALSNLNKAEIVFDLAALEAEIGPDPFWSANLLDDADADADANADANTDADSDAAASATATPATALTLEPLMEHLFVCLVLLKSKSATLLELDQSEIKACLGTLYRSKDIEGIISEAGECWRTWRYTEDADDDDD